MPITDRIKNAWSAFMNKDPTGYIPQGYSYSYYSGGSNQFMPILTRGNERTIITSAITRIAVFASQIDIRHIELDKNGRFIGEKDSPLNRVFSIAANKDQPARAFWQDVVITMLDEGSVAMVPTMTNKSIIHPKDQFDIGAMRTAKIVEWKPDDVKVNIYNDITGKREDMWLPKASVAIAYNPFYAIMNEPNSILKRLIRKLNLLDTIDENNASNKLNMLIQVPYAVKGERKRSEVNERLKQIETDVNSSPLGIGYVDGTEHVIQLNRAIDSNLLPQIEQLFGQFYSQMGFTKEVMDGSASPDQMNHFESRTIEPIVSAIVDALNMKYIPEDDKTQTIAYFRDIFKLIPVNQLADYGDKLTRNAIMTSNEFRQRALGMRPSDQAIADELSNKNMPAQDEPQAGQLEDEQEYVQK